MASVFVSVLAATAEEGVIMQEGEQGRLQDIGQLQNINEFAEIVTFGSKVTDGDCKGAV